MKLSAIAFWFCPLLGLGGCADIIDGSTQNVSVQTINEAGPLASAQCALDNKKGNWLVTTPGSVKVHRGSEPLQVTCTRAGYLPDTEMVAASTNNMIYWNIALGGGLGATVDTVSGAAWKYPQTINVLMQPQAGTSVAAAQPPGKT